MANFENKVNVHDDAPVTNYISQIKIADGTTYDIATHHSIKFVEGGEETTWNGISDLTVVIPTITDIVQTPIEFAGTVSADNKIDWISPHGKDDKAVAGNLVFITVDCTFGGKACEAGDMAIYDGTKWNIVSGENQVEIVGGSSNVSDTNRTTVAVGSAKDVLVVEGKALALTLDYSDFNTNHVEKTYGDIVPVNFKNITVGDAYVKLTKTDGEKITVEGKDVTFERATALKNGTVTLTNADSLVNSVTFGTFNAGEFPTLNKNSKKTLEVDGGSLVKGVGSDFVESVSINDVTFIKAAEDDQNKIVMLTGLTPGQGNEFFSGIHATTANETADLTIKGYIAPTKEGVTFVEGLKNNATPVVGINPGSFSLANNKTQVAVGLGSASSAVGDVLSSVTVSAKNDTSVLNSATVSNHVLTFGATNVTSDVEATCMYKNLETTTYSWTAPSAVEGEFETSGFAAVADTKYTFGRTKETTYTSDTAMWKLNTPALTVNKAAYSFVDDGMIATVPDGTFVISQTAGTLPSMTNGEVGKVSVTGTVGTDLTFATQTIHAATDIEFNLPSYTLGEGSEGDGVLVGKAGAVVAKEATVNLATYLMDVNVVTEKDKQ